ncbi:MAG TPA: phosphate-starvation-inducible PsiE family protein [Candidatus Binatia bacterium]
MAKSQLDAHRDWAARSFTLIEDIVYIGLGVLLAVSSMVLLATGIMDFVQNLLSGSFPQEIVALLDRILLVLLFVELLYTVQVSFREHTIVPEPFLLVGLIAAIRRVLVLTAEFAEIADKSEEVFRHFIYELGALTVLIVALVASLYILTRQGVRAGAERA